MAIRFRIPPPPRPPPALALALGVLLPLGILVLQLALRPLFEPTPFLGPLVVVSVTASIGGWGPGFLAVFVSAACGYTFVALSPSPDHAARAALSGLLFLPAGAIMAGFGAVVRDGFRERERTALDLDAAVRARDEFIWVASHELKTPLTSLSLLVHQLVRRAARSAVPDPEVTRLTERLGRQTQRLAVVVNNLLDVSRITSGGMILDIQETDLAAVAREVAERFSHEGEETGAVAIAVEADGPVSGRWDRFRLEEVLTNLLANALKYGEGSPVHLAVRQDGGSARLTVTDHGIGVPPEDQARIFERFERGTRTGAQAGIGLGLWIVSEIVKAHGGTVGVVSVPGEGTTFTVLLPLPGPVSRVPPPGPPAPA